MKFIDRYFVASLIIWVVATVDAIGGLWGFWSVTGKERLVVLSIEGAVLVGLLANCYAIKNWVYCHSTDASHRIIAWITVASLALCVCGDVVNFNLPLTYYRYGGVVKHDYLADSVFFFGPGYFFFLVAVCWVALAEGFKPKALFALLVIASLIGGASFISMHLPGTGEHVSIVVGTYAVLITLVGASGIVLLMALRKSPARLGVWLVAMGLVLATVADGVIGQFWIYGNDGKGYFPAAKYVNWSLYIGSQCMVMHLARVAVWHRDGAYEPVA